MLRLGLGIAIIKTITGNVVPAGYKQFVVKDSGGSNFVVKDGDYNVK